MYKAKQFLEEMQAAQDSYVKSKQIDEKFAPRRVKKTLDNGRVENRLRFDDGSYCFFYRDDAEGVMHLPVQFDEKEQHRIKTENMRSANQMRKIPTRVSN